MKRRREGIKEKKIEERENKGKKKMMRRWEWEIEKKK